MALSKNEKVKIVEEVKPILRKKESEFANNDAYKELKTEIKILLNYFVN